MNGSRRMRGSSGLAGAPATGRANAAESKRAVSSLIGPANDNRPLLLRRGGAQNQEVPPKRIVSARTTSPRTSDTRIGISGWRYGPWRGTFYPKDLAQRRELEYASRQINSIEINGSFYSLQRPQSYRQWYDQT